VFPQHLDLPVATGSSAFREQAHRAEPVMPEHVQVGIVGQVVGHLQMQAVYAVQQTVPLALGIPAIP